MSTVVVAKKDGQIAIGADTLTCLGHTLESAEYVVNSSKILKVGRSYIAHVGDASWQLVLTSLFKKMGKTPALDSPQNIFETALRLHRSLKKGYFLNTDEDEDDAFESSQFHCLIANPVGIFGLYALRSSHEYTKFYAMGCGSPFALGAMHAAYARGTAEEIARAGVEAAAEFDDSTGLPVEVFTMKLRSKKRR